MARASLSVYKIRSVVPNDSDAFFFEYIHQVIQICHNALLLNPVARIEAMCACTNSIFNALNCL